MPLSRNPKENLEKSIEALQNIQSFISGNNPMEKQEDNNKKFKSQGKNNLSKLE